MDTCHSAFASSAARYADRPFIHIPAVAAAGYSATAIDFTYGEASAIVSDLAEDYASAGYSNGAVVALMLDNRADFFLHFLALNACGACVAPVHPELSADEKAHLINHSDASLLVSHDDFGLRVRQALEKIDSAPPVRMLGVGGVPEFAGGRKIEARAGRHAPAALLYTSGTTGRPKGCLLTNGYFDSWGRWYLGLGGLARLRDGAERLITPLPLNHQNALACSFMGMVMSGGCIIQLDRFHPKTWWRAVRESRATILHYLGVMPAMLLTLPPADEDDFSGQVRFGLGAGVDPKHHAAFERRFGFPLLEGWAMTETPGWTCLMTTNEPRNPGDRRIGRASATMKWRLIDQEGNDAATGEPGELHVGVAGDNPRADFFSGYYKDEPATEEAWQGGLFRTGDVMRRDADGFFYFVDRSKNVIRRSGENISAIEVEAALLQDSRIKACAVAAAPDDVRGEEVMAMIVLVAGQSPSPETASQIRKTAAERLAYYKTPGLIAFVEELPLGATQKVKRGDVKALCSAILSSKRYFDLTSSKKRPSLQEKSE